MHRLVGWVVVIGLCCLGCAGGGRGVREKPDEPLVEAQADFDAAMKFREEGKYAEALVRAEQALSRREAVLGGSHLDVATSLNLVGDLYRRKGDLPHAEQSLQRGLALREALLGPSHLDVAASLNNLAILYMVQGDYAQARALHQRALDMREALLGPIHTLVADSLGNLANLYMEQESYDRAEPLAQRALAMREALVDPHHPHVASALANLAAIYSDQGKYALARPLLERALALRQEALGPQHPDVAASLNNLAVLHARQGRNDLAEPLYQSALDVRLAALGPQHLLVADSLSNLANVYSAQAQYTRAEPYYQRALGIFEATLGPNHPKTASSINNLAILYWEQGRYHKAESHYQRALAISEATVGQNHPLYAESLQHLANLYLEQGLYDRAEPHYLRALAISEAALGPNHPSVAGLLNNLATLYKDQGRYKEAESHYQRALGIAEAVLGPNNPEFAAWLNNLALLYKTQGLYGQAERLYQRGLALTEAALGPNHPQVAIALQNLGGLYLEQGLPAKAESFIQRASAIHEATLGPNHPRSATSLYGLAILRLSQHRLDDALPLLTRVLALTEQRLRQEAFDFSEARFFEFLRYLRNFEERIYALLHAYPKDARVQRLAFSTALLFKSRSLDEAARIYRTGHLNPSPEDRDAFVRLRGLRTRFAALAFDESVPKQQLQALIDQGEKLEGELASRSTPLRDLPHAHDILERVAASLPQDGALVEFIVDEGGPLVTGTGSRLPLTPGSRRYLALVLFPDASTHAVDLGLAGDIDRAVSDMRRAMESPGLSPLVSAQGLYQRIFAPLRPLLGSTRRLLLSPDGQLGLVPFDALHDGHRFLIDSYDFTYLSSGRESLPRPQPIPPSSSVFVFADPDFTAAASSPSAVEPASSRSGPWDPLPSTREEALGIQRLLPQTQSFLGAEATKERLLQLRAPGILHVATHGFFLHQDPPSARRPDERGTGMLEPLGGPRPRKEPLLNSGLVLAGANATVPAAPTAHPDTARITALELAGLDLWGTQLVTLSACETGLGEVYPGQGVQGLRRALVVAGAQTVVMSLWNVRDDSTPLLMNTYYRNLMAGQGRASALREAMRSQRATYPHPYYWAPFIALGSDEPLRGITPSPPAPPR